MDWYYVAGDKWNGPHSEDELTAFLRNRKIDGDTLVWREGMADWTPIGSIETFDVPPNKTSRGKIAGNEKSKPTRRPKTPPTKSAKAHSGARRKTTGAAPAAGGPKKGAKIDRPSAKAKARSTQAKRSARRTIAAIVLGIAVTTLVTRSLVTTDLEMREAARSKGPKTGNELAVQRSWKNPVTGLTANLPPGWTYRLKKSKTGRDIHTFSPPDNSKLVYIEAQAPSDISGLGDYVERYEKAMAHQARFDGKWEEVSLFGRTMRHTSGEYLKLGYPLDLYLEKTGSTYWLIIVAEKHKSASGAYDAMPVVKSLLRTLP